MILLVLQFNLKIHHFGKIGGKFGDLTGITAVERGEGCNHFRTIKTIRTIAALGKIKMLPSSH